MPVWKFVQQELLFPRHRHVRQGRSCSHRASVAIFNLNRISFPNSTHTRQQLSDEGKKAKRRSHFIWYVCAQSFQTPPTQYTCETTRSSALTNANISDHVFLRVYWLHLWSHLLRGVAALPPDDKGPQQPRLHPLRPSPIPGQRNVSRLPANSFRPGGGHTRVGAPLDA